ncbi:MAG: hypothetical protein R2705_06895 [Ilumatobacteraceae bacterium]
MSVALTVFRRYGIAVVTVALFLFLAGTTDGFLTSPNFRNILDQQSTLLIAASFVTITMIAGGFDLSVASVFVVAPLFALQVEHQTGSTVLAAVTGVAVGLVVGPRERNDRDGVEGELVHRHARHVVHVVRYRVPGERPAQHPALHHRPLSNSRAPVRADRTTWIAFVSHHRSMDRAHEDARFGRQVFAVGGNPEAARLAGVSVSRVMVGATRWPVRQPVWRV